MPALQLAADTPMHSSPPHFYIHPQAFHASSSSPPLSSDPNCSTYFHCTSDATAILSCSDGDHHLSPDLPCTLRFGDIPAASTALYSTSPNLQQLHGSYTSSLVAPAEISVCGGKAEAKLLNRSQSMLTSRRSTSPLIRGNTGRDFEEGGPCCTGDGGLCGGSVNCTMASSPRLPEALLALQKFLPSNNMADEEGDDEEIWAASDSWPALDVYSCDDFRMFEFKVRKCVRGRSHDWTECPFAHPGEKARRRDPRRYHYSGTACPDFRKGNCRRGEACEYSHGVFECWLHPTRYRTQPCKDGKGCRRRVCFFAHTPEQLRMVPAEGESPPTTPGSCGSSSGGSTRSSLLKAAALSGGAYDGSPLRRALAGSLDGAVALEVLLDDSVSKKNVPAGACTHHHHHHHWLGTGSSPSSTLVGLSACATSPVSPISSPILSPASPLVSHSGVPAHRRHLDRLRSIPTLSIPAADDTSIGSPPQGSPSPHRMAELMYSLQISPSARTVQSCRALPSAPSAWPLISKLQHAPSAPSTPKPRYGHPINMIQINVGPEPPPCSPYAMMKPGTGRSNSSSAAIVTASAAGGEIQPPTGVDCEVPDLEWVNELVQ